MIHDIIMFFCAPKWGNVVRASGNWGVIKVINRLTRELFTAMVEYRPACFRSSP
jgi:hypothetical protein